MTTYFKVHMKWFPVVSVVHFFPDQFHHMFLASCFLLLCSVNLKCGLGTTRGKPASNLTTELTIADTQKTHRTPMTRVFHSTYSSAGVLTPRDASCVSCIQLWDHAVPPDHSASRGRNLERVLYLFVMQRGKTFHGMIEINDGLWDLVIRCLKEQQPKSAPSPRAQWRAAKNRSN